MKGLKGMRLGLVGAAVAGLALIGGFLLVAQVSAVSHAVSIGSASAAPGEDASVDLEALNITDPGLGAWTVDITYDTSVVSVADCSPEEGGVCNPEFEAGVIRVTGASASGLEGDTVLATITFTCADAEGETDLALSINVLADATVGDPQDIDAATQDGSVTCEVPAAATATPIIVPSGTGGVSDGGSALGWLIAALAGAGLAAIVGLGALRLRERRP